MRLWILNPGGNICEALFCQVLLFSLENGCDVQLVQLFVDVVNTELLEIVVLKVLKSKDVEQTNRLRNLFEAFWIIVNFTRQDSPVHFEDQPIEEVVVELLGEGVPVVHADLEALGGPHFLVADHIDFLQ